ncbi:P-loop containing nucleoside triphosphate hydrolase protein [Podospora appendiculata]|uniref:P-loop containing nucleoside triphosphate hydrolase protein n=1 Tax=Podospora appendiculata TaxID=314037 RepID=A0AAE0XFA8_9PEZI|nr:P-loop containing nucleoside triphosphate hydrolase protein [Podospora appendiculata]
MNPADVSANGASTSTEKNASSLCQPSQLQSKEYRDLLDVVDRLRNQGLSRYVDLPQIIVCGDQSSGKSSALEAISGMSFPAKDNLCTRFATELILRRAPVAGIDISISPGSDRTEDEQATLEAFTYTGTLEALDLGRIIDDAKNTMGLNEASKVFSTDVLRVEVSGPSQPHLTLVDLPGLFLAGNKDQSEQDAALIEKLVLSYMKNPRTIILAVVSAKSDFALQQVTRHTREQDPRGKRTLGLITKPDTLDQGSDSEQFYIQLAQNKDVHFGLGWHVLRNRTYAERNDSAAARDAAEADFFSNGVWTSLKPSQLGVASLRLRLSQVLRNQILWQLPSVLEDVTRGIDECRATLQQLGTPRVTSAEQRRHLLKVSARWSEMARAAIDGTYTDSFFHEAADRRLRAIMQKTLAAFAKEMHLKGHAKNIIDYSDEEDSDDDIPGPHVIRRSTYIDKVKMLMVDSRGRELPGTYNPLIVAELFRKQCKPWHGMVRSVLESTFHAASRTMESILQHAADEETATALLSIVVAPAMEAIRAGLWSEADKILEPHISGHPITYNHYLTDNVQKAQAQRLRLKLEEHLKSFFNTSKLSSGPMDYRFDMLTLFDKLTIRMEPDMDTYSCSMAIDMMEAYYKVALKTVIDSVSTLAVERCLLQKLPGILNPEVVCELPDDIVSRIAAEGPESVAKREQATEKLAVLEEAMVELRRLGTPSGQGTEGVTAV